MICIVVSKIIVLIPNGMEFYNIITTQKYITANSFNSQRDGILPDGRVISILQKLFQFPTGWNSTTNKYVNALTTICFNSQRDGILRYMFLVGWYITFVSIPNGMEFYVERPI